MAHQLDLAVNSLTREHREIGKVLSAMSLIADDLEHWKFIGASRLADVTSFLWMFVNGCQRALEENRLFPALESKCLSHAACFLPVLVDEHQRAESLIQELSAAVHLYVSSGGARKESLIDALRQLVTLYRGHLWKEENVLLSTAENVLSQDEQAELEQSFDTRLQAELNELADKIERQSKQEFSHLGEVLF